MEIGFSTLSKYTVEARKPPGLPVVPVLPRCDSHRPAVGQSSPSPQPAAFSPRLQSRAACSDPPADRPPQPWGHRRAAHPHRSPPHPWPARLLVPSAQKGPRVRRASRTRGERLWPPCAQSPKPGWVSSAHFGPSSCVSVFVTGCAL